MQSEFELDALGIQSGEVGSVRGDAYNHSEDTTYDPSTLQIHQHLRCGGEPVRHIHIECRIHCEHGV